MYRKRKRGPARGFGRPTTAAAIFVPRTRRRTARRTVPRSRFRNIRTGGFLGQELKFYDTSLVGDTLVAPTDAAGGEVDPSATIVLNSVTQGDGEQQRDGRKMTMKSIYINGMINIPAKTTESSADEASQVFIALVLDTQTNGATITSENVFVNKSAAAVLAASPMRNLEFSTRYRVLKSKQFVIQNPNIANNAASTGNLVQQGLQRQFKMFVDLKDLGVTFNGTTETVANITDNSLHMIAYTSSLTLFATISYNSRLRFMG